MTTFESETAGEAGLFVPTELLSSFLCRFSVSTSGVDCALVTLSFFTWGENEEDEIFCLGGILVGGGLLSKGFGSWNLGLW